MNLSCHCGNIEIKVAFKPKTLTLCNCSVCHRHGFYWGYYKPKETEIKIDDFGASSYIWGDKCLEFIHCKQCGCVTHYQTLEGDSDPKVGVNFRMAKFDEIENIVVRKFDGASM